MIRTVLLFCSLLLLATTGFAQQDSVLKISLLRTIKIEAESFMPDNLGNLYVVTKANQLKKINEKGDSLGIFNELRRYGKLHSIDASNPLKVLLFYKDFTTVVVLDRFLNIRQVTDLRKKQMPQVSAIAQSYDNNIWIFDELDSKLKKISDDGMLIGETIDFRQLFDTLPLPAQMTDRDGFVYLYDKRMGMYVFDYYGALKNNYPIEGWNNFFVQARVMIGLDTRFVYRVEPASLLFKKWNLPAALVNSLGLQVTHNRIYALKPGCIEVYAF
jgi:hypothetical protein